MAAVRRKGRPHSFCGPSDPCKALPGVLFDPRRMGDFVAVQSENSRLCSVDIARVGRLYSPDMARRPLHGAMARLRSSSLITVTRPPILVGGGRLRRLSGLPGSGDRPVPGCLTGESEERETWTAESLRAASSIERTRPDETSAVLRFRSTPWRRKSSEWDLVKREVTSRYQSSHPT